MLQNITEWFLVLNTEAQRMIFKVIKSAEFTTTM